MAADQMVTEFAVLSLDNVRGGPWCRAHHNHSPGVAEINDGTQDTFYVAGYALFGKSPRPDYLFTDQILIPAEFPDQVIGRIGIVVQTPVEPDIDGSRMAKQWTSHLCQGS